VSPPSYREVLPAPILRRFIECYWFLRADRAAPSDPQPILPDGCMELVFNLGAPFRRCHPDGRSPWSEEQPSRMLVGQMDHHVTVRATGPVDVVGVRFHPTGAHPLFRFPMAELANELVPLEDVVALPERFGSASSMEDRRRTLDAILSTRFENTATLDSDFERAVGSVVEAEGRVSTDTLAALMGVGPRQLERRFRERVGLGPKRFAKVLRFQSVFRRAFLDERPWAELALDCGYYDQAHFIRDFKSFTGRSPSALFSHENAVTRVFTRRRRKSGLYNTSF
jgi:AraC-like DNA-binding protein